METKNHDMVVGVTFLFIIMGIVSIFAYYIIFKLSVTQPKFSALIISGVLTAVGSVSAIIISKKQDRRITIENELRMKKVPMYSSIVETMMSIFQKEKQIVSKKIKQLLLIF